MGKPVSGNKEALSLISPSRTVPQRCGGQEKERHCIIGESSKREDVNAWSLLLYQCTASQANQAIIFNDSAIQFVTFVLQPAVTQAFYYPEATFPGLNYSITQTAISQFGVFTSIGLSYKYLIPCHPKNLHIGSRYLEIPLVSNSTYSSIQRSVQTKK